MDSVPQALEAIKSGDLSAFKSLLAADSSLAGARVEGNMSLMLMGPFFVRADMVETILATGRALDIYEAAALGKTELLGRLLDGSPGLLDEYAPYGFTPLHHAAYMADDATVKLLLDRGA